MHSCIGTFFICSTSTCFCTSHIVSSAGTSSGAFAYSTSTPNKLGHRLWSYCNVWKDRYWNFICITQPSYLELVWNIWIFHKVLTPNICCGMYDRSIIMLISRTSRSWGNFIYLPGWLWKHFHLNFSAVLACRSFLCQGACTKILSQPETTSSEGISTTPSWLSAVSSAGVASVKALKAVFLPIPQYVPMCHILLNSENPKVLQLLMSQDVHILVSAKFFPVVTCSH